MDLKMDGSTVGTGRNLILGVRCMDSLHVEGVWWGTRSLAYTRGVGPDDVPVAGDETTVLVVGLAMWYVIGL